VVPARRDSFVLDAVQEAERGKLVLQEASRLAAVALAAHAAPGMGGAIQPQARGALALGADVGLAPEVLGLERQLAPVSEGVLHQAREAQAAREEVAPLVAR
jgi:hypothetical protein